MKTIEKKENNKGMSPLTELETQKLRFFDILFSMI